MNKVEKNPQVRAYFSRFDREALALGAQRAKNLREELTSHLLEALPPGASDSDVARALTDMGDPFTIVGQEVESAALAGYVRPSIRPIVVAAAASLGLLLALLIAAPAVLTLPGLLALVVLLLLMAAVALFAALAISRSVSRHKKLAWYNRS